MFITTLKLQNSSLQTMKRLYFILCFALTVLVNQSSAQVDKKSQIQNTYASYFSLERENIHLHLNKNVFILEEPVWFKAYIYNKDSNKPAVNSTNIFVALYDNNGKEIDKKLFFAQNGVVSGTLDLSQKVIAGKYYLRAFTNWMNNFSEDESFISLPINVINPYVDNSSNNITTFNTNTAYDIQFLPEGGYAISNTTNTIGVKLIDENGKGISSKGVIVDSNNTEITNFKTNDLGFGKFNLTCKENEAYFAEYTINNETHKSYLPKIKKEGFSISIDNYTNEKLTYINLKTNKNTLESNTNKTFYLVINQNSKISVVNLDINALNTENTIPVPSENLVAGVNTITLFDSDLNPILERLIFNYNSINLASVNTNLKKVKDSIVINLKVNSKNNNQSSRLSVSSLPNSTITNATKADIISIFLIQPYIKGQVQNANYYFKNVDRLKKYELDLLMLTQGWSKYEWNHIKKGQVPATYSFDVGIKIEGTFNRDAKKHQNNKAQMFSMTNDVNENTFIDKHTNQFIFDNYYLKDGAVINFSLYENGRAVPKVNPVIKTVNGNRRLTHGFPKYKKQLYKNRTAELESAFKSYNIEKLDTVNLSYTKQKTVETPLEHQKSYIANKYSNGIKIDSTIERSYFNIAELINANGFVVEDLAGTGFSRIKNRNPTTFLGSNEPILIIDNVNMGNNYDMLFNLTFEDIDEIYISTSGLGYGAQAGAGVIRVYRKNGSQSLEKMKLKNFGDVIIKNGFSTKKTFYTPTYYFKSDDVLSSYACLDWESDITTNDLGMFSYKIKDLGLNEITLVIQGFTDSGELISEIVSTKLE